ncbi:MAG: hypothetical protein ACRDDY_03695 [Clostridium sp.]|uniref:hypothetical protein n=1 Tax=Clostridium sp. TaxID=1506 RepID=UPI003EE5CF39
MALLIKKDGRILCAKFYEKEKGDIYVDDAVHEWLANCLGKEYGEPIIGNYSSDTHQWFKLNDEDRKRDFDWIYGV